MTGMTMGTPMTGMTIGVESVPMMAAMMLPSAIPAITRRAREDDGMTAVPLFVGAYLGVWAVVAVAIWVAYQPPGTVMAAALLVGAGLYELTPLKRACRRRCRERERSGLRFGVHCVGSSLGLMLVLVAVDVMSVALMVAIAVVVLAQKVLPPVPAIDVPLALALLALGVAVAAT